ncbi:MAG: hypothetical protein AAGD01_01460 [Acidobacteriota bacterium]
MDTTPRSTPPRQIDFEATPEIFATDASGAFSFPLRIKEDNFLETQSFDELRFVFSLWHPAAQRRIDLDRAYVELRFCPRRDEEQHWIKLSEIEPVVAPYAPGDSFDGWVVLPVLSASAAYLLVGGGFEPRARLQIRASAYMVA